MSLTNVGNLRQRWSLSNSGLHNEATNQEVSICTPGNPNLRSVVHLSRTVVTSTPLSPVWALTVFFATIFSASKNSVRAYSGFLGMARLRYTYLQTASTCSSVSGITRLKLGDGINSLAVGLESACGRICSD